MRHLLLIAIVAPVLTYTPGVFAQDSDWSQARIREILSPPTNTEVEQIAEAWRLSQSARAEHSGFNAEVVESGTLTYGAQEFDVRVFKHRVGVDDHFTAIYVPHEAADETLPLLVEIRGVRWDYPRRDIRTGPFVMSLLGDMIGDFVIIEPCLRGHELLAIAQTHHAGGDRRDSYDGAAEDASAAVTVAMSEVQEWDQRNVFSFGLSRGGGVALLHGQRDTRVTGVVAMSAPVDWISLMRRGGENWEDRIYQTASTYDGPENDRSAQFYEWFLEGRHELSNTEVRRRIIASSPLYFADRLPPTQINQGTADTAIPSANAAAMSDRFLSLGLDEARYQVIFHEGAGHLLRGTNAGELTRAFLRTLIGDRDGK